PTFVFERDDPRAEAVNEAARADLYRAAMSLGGTITAEHGVGVARRDYLTEQVGADVVSVMRSIKRALDPDGILNPGKMLPPLSA
ncbi:MAG TPA: FAD-linked oxidase C-terminal domain-containing protein, partial [Candidatus Limnocylindrales bacterium]